MSSSRKRLRAEDAAQLRTPHAAVIRRNNIAHVAASRPTVRRLFTADVVPVRGGADRVPVPPPLAADPSTKAAITMATAQNLAAVAGQAAMPAMSGGLDKTSSALPAVGFST